MARYTVTWTRFAEKRLLEIWLGTQRRADITAAANEMDVRLLRDPHKAGLKVDEELRQLIIGPLAILYGLATATSWSVSWTSTRCPDESLNRTSEAQSRSHLHRVISDLRWSDDHAA